MRMRLPIRKNASAATPRPRTQEGAPCFSSRETFRVRICYLRSSNDEVERRGASPASNEGTLSQSSIPSLAHRRRDPRSLEPIVSWLCAIPHEARDVKSFQVARSSVRCAHATPHLSRTDSYHHLLLQPAS